MECHSDNDRDTGQLLVLKYVGSRIVFVKRNRIRVKRLFVVLFYCCSSVNGAWV